ncbi:hypothetical protein [Vibrio paucivorans]
MNIMMYVITVLVVILCWKSIQKVISAVNHFLMGSIQDWRHKEDRLYNLFIGAKIDLESFREEVSQRIMKGFCYGIGFCLGVWWLFPWLYR